MSKLAIYPRLILEQAQRNPQRLFRILIHRFQQVPGSVAVTCFAVVAQRSIAGDFPHRTPAGRAANLRRRSRCRYGVDVFLFICAFS